MAYSTGDVSTRSTGDTEWHQSGTDADTGAYRGRSEYDYQEQPASGLYLCVRMGKEAVINNHPVLLRQDFISYGEKETFLRGLERP